MTVTMNLPAEVEEAWRAEAQAKGVPVEELLQEIIVSHRPAPRLSREEKLRRFQEWVANLPHTDVVLPDEAMERESIYGDHGR